MRKRLNFVLYICLGIVLFLSVPSFVNRGFSQESIWSACLPKEARSYEVLAQYNNYLVIQYSNPENRHLPRQMLIKTIEQSQECEWIMGSQELYLHSKTHFISQEVARELALDQYKRAIQKFGKDELQFVYSDENSFVDGGNYLYIFPEDKWALDLLGIKLGSRYKVVDQVPETDALDPTEYFE